MWEQMYRATVNYGRKGLPVQALSAIDLAIWDVLGKIRNEPVYALLGGKTKDRLPVYWYDERHVSSVALVGAVNGLSVFPPDARASISPARRCLTPHLHFLAQHVVQPRQRQGPRLCWRKGRRCRARLQGRALPRPLFTQHIGACNLLLVAQVPCPYGPSAGDEGLRKNVEFFKVSKPAAAATRRQASFPSAAPARRLTARSRLSLRAGVRRSARTTR